MAFIEAHERQQRVVSWKNVLLRGMEQFPAADSVPCSRAKPLGWPPLRAFQQWVRAGRLYYTIHGSSATADAAVTTSATADALAMVLLLPNIGGHMVHSLLQSPPLPGFSHLLKWVRVPLFQSHLSGFQTFIASHRVSQSITDTHCISQTQWDDIRRHFSPHCSSHWLCQLTLSSPIMACFQPCTDPVTDPWSDGSPIWWQNPDASARRSATSRPHQALMETVPDGNSNGKWSKESNLMAIQMAILMAISQGNLEILKHYPFV